MRVAVLAVVMGLVFAALAAAVAAAQSITVVFDKPVYDKGDVVSMTVKGLEPPATLAVEVYSPDGRLVWVHEEDNIPFTEAVLSFKLPDNAPEGVYKVYIAVEGGQPLEYNFTVHRPEFIITSATISPATVETGKQVTVSVDVKNVGAEGSFYIVVVSPDNTTVAEVGPITLGYMETGSYQLAFTAPTKAGVFNYTVETVNVKYGTIDSSRVLQLAVHYPPPPPTVVVPPPAPVAPPTATTTTPATTTKPATTTTPPANATAAFTAYVGDVIGANGVVAKAVKVVAPAIGVEVLFPSGTMVLGPTGTPVQPAKLVINVLARVPPVEPPNIIVGPAVDIRFEGYARVSFNQSVMVTVPYDPAKVPPGYVVRLSYYDPDIGKWVPLPTIKVDPVTGKVTGLTKHFTVFAAIAYRVVTPVTTTATVTVTKPVTTTVTTTVTTAAPATTTTTVTATVVQTETTTVTTTAPPVTLTQTVVQPVTVTKTKEYTVTSTSTVTKTTKQVVTVTASPATVTSTTTVTKTKTPGWAYASLAAVVILVVAVIILALRYGRSGGTGGS